MREQENVLEITYITDVLKLIEPLLQNGYTAKLKPIPCKFPRENDIKHYEVTISKMVGETDGKID